MTSNTTTTPTPSPLYLLRDRSDPANPRIVIAYGRWSLPATDPDSLEMPATAPVVEWLASLSPNSHDWVDDPLEPQLVGWEPLDNTTVNINS